ncbi:MAG: DUF3179 domain-containing (seleno)protein, partial [Acidimicrobiales bacterium]
MRSLRPTVALLLGVALLAAACGADDLEDRAARGGFFPDLLDPTETDEARPDNYRESLPRDAITPVYDPSFVAASGVDWPEDELVIGVEFDGEARAYPVGFLTWREIVIDNHRGIPTLV